MIAVGVQTWSTDISAIERFWRAADELGYAPQVKFEDGLAQTVDWYRERRDWWEPLKAELVPAR